MRTTETTSLSDELSLCKEEEEEIVSLGDSRVRDRLINMLTVRVAVLEASYIKRLITW